LTSQKNLFKKTVDAVDKTESAEHVARAACALLADEQPAF
jgi:hypothetical protein